MYETGAFIKSEESQKVKHQYSILTHIHGNHQMANIEIRLIIFFSVKDGEALYSQKKQVLTDCGSDHELLIAKFRLKLKKGGKTSRPFRFDLNQNPL